MRAQHVTYQIDQEVVWLESDDEIRLYNAASGEFLTLSGTATDIWRLVAGGQTVDEIISVLVQKYAGGSARDGVRVGQDIVGFLESLVARGVLLEGAEGPKAET
jgi:Coenzyme PQQ synthesis protein D (PqqD)